MTARSRRRSAARQLDDLAAIGVTWDDPPEYQTRATDRYDAVDRRAESDRGLGVRMLSAARRDILGAPRAPHAPEGRTRARAAT